MAKRNDIQVETAPREVIITRLINAPRELVFDAFTKAEHLRKWFGPHSCEITAETDPRVGGKFRITMHGTAEMPAPFAGLDFPMNGEYTEFVRPERLAYTADLSEHPQQWKDMVIGLMGNATNEDYLHSRTSVSFEALDGKTILTVRVYFASDAVRDGYEGMDEGWAQSFEKLDKYLAGIVIVERTFDAPVERVWDAISNNDAMKKWYFKLPEFRAEVGFEFGFEGGPQEKTYLHKCKVVEVIPQKKLAYSWRFEGYEGNSMVSFELSPEGNGTKLRLTHSGLNRFVVNDNRDLDAHNFAEGWTDIIGRSLKGFVETQSSSINRTMAATRILNAPRELVWKAITEPGHIKHWWGPNGFTLTTHEYEMRVGGEWNFTMHGPDGTDYQNEMVFEEIVPNEQIVFTHGPVPKFQMFIQLFDRGDRTELHWRNVFETEEDYKRAVEVFNAVEGLEQNIGRLEAYLKTF